MRSHWLVQITYCMLGGDLIRTEWVCNTSPSSFLIKLPTYCFIRITARTRVLSNPHYKSWWKNRANEVKWINWTQVRCICMNATFQTASAQTTFYLYFTLRRLNGHPNSFGAPSRAYDQLRVCHTYLHTEMRAAQYKQTQVFCQFCWITSFPDSYRELTLNHNIMTAANIKYFSPDPQSGQPVRFGISSSKVWVFTWM